MGNYIYHLLHAIANLDPCHNFILFVDSGEAIKSIPSHKNFKIKVLHPAIYPIWEQFCLPLAIREENLSILHCPFNTAPLYGIKIPLLITIHDVMYLFPPAVLPESASLYQRMGRYYRKVIATRAAKKARAIIADSETSKRDVLKLLSPDVSVKTIYADSGIDFSRLPDNSFTINLFAKHGIKQPYILGFAARDPRKNTKTLIEAFIRFKEKFSMECQLLLVGMNEAQGTKLFCKKLNKQQTANIKFPGFVDEEMLKAFYLNAKMLVFPSLYEGFGLPVLEAMNAGIPVIATKRGSLEEIGGDAALYVEPDDSEEISNAIHKMFMDGETTALLINKGKERAKQFSWEKSAKEVLCCYEKYAD
jgi:glycosyltransferase involved in cell wall biosynthesis